MRKNLFELILFLIVLFSLVVVNNLVAADESQVSREGLAAYFSFNEGSGDIAHDYSGNNNDGMINGATWVDGISGKALSFNGVNDYVSLPTSILGNWNSLTYSVWVKVPLYSGSGWPSFIGGYSTNFINNDNIGIWTDTGTLLIEVDTDTGNYGTNGEISIPWDTWFHAAMVYDGSSLTEYVNGVRGRSIPASGYLKNVAELNLGQHGSGMYYLDGLIDEVYIFSRALSEDEIKNLYGLSPLSEKEDNRDNKAADRSPLSLVIDKKYVPIVATAASIFLIYLWNISGNTFFQFIKDYIASHIRSKKSKKKKINKKIDFSYKIIKNIDIKEIFSIFLAIIIFAIVMSWTWSVDLSDFIMLFFINFFIVSFVLGFKETSRVYLSHKYKLKTQYVFWPFGALLTICSTILGNTFSLTYYIVFEEEKNIKKFGEMYFFVYLILYIISLTAFILNIFTPWVVFQMIFVFIIMGLFIFLAPIKPMTGYNIKNWSFEKWLIFYVIVSISYIIMNFSIY